jgi:hypothetical protein
MKNDEHEYAYNVYDKYLQYQKLMQISEAVNVFHHNMAFIAVILNSIFQYFEDISSINNDKIHSYVDCIYPS